MSITVRANQGNTENQPWGVSTASQKDSADQIKNRNVVDARSLLIGGSTDQRAAQKRSSVRNQAMKLIRDAWKNDEASVTSRKEMDAARAQALEEARTYTDRANFLEKEKQNLMEEYGVDPNSKEQKDLELLEKYQNNISGAAQDSFSDEELDRLRELQNSSFTDYQKKALTLNSAKNNMLSEADRKKSEALLQKQNMTDAKIEQLKSQDMLKAQNAADELEGAAEADIFNMLIQDGKDTIDEKAEENKKKAEEAAEKKEEQEERIDAIQEKKQQQEELAAAISESNAAPEPPTQSVAEENTQKHTQADIIQGEIDTEMLKADTAAQSKQVNNVENAQTHINKLMKKNNLINEDLKGIEIDLNF